MPWRCSLNRTTQATVPRLRLLEGDHGPAPGVAVGLLVLGDAGGGIKGGKRSCVAVVQQVAAHQPVCDPCRDGYPEQAAALAFTWDATLFVKSKEVE